MAAAQRRRASAAARRGPKSDYHTAPSSFIRQTTAAVIPVYPDDTNADMFGASLHLWKCHVEPLLSSFHYHTKEPNLGDAMLQSPEVPNKVKYTDAILNLTSEVRLLLSNYRVEFVFCQDLMG